ncbi:hypothetical protein MRX96_012958 [Rhipicephalus microplus]
MSSERVVVRAPHGERASSVAIGDASNEAGRARWWDASTVRQLISSTAQRCPPLSTEGCLRRRLFFSHAGREFRLWASFVIPTAQSVAAVGCTTYGQ